jgi:hypothetical protein
VISILSRGCCLFSVFVDLRSSVCVISRPPMCLFVEPHDGHLTLWPNSVTLSISWKLRSGTPSRFLWSPVTIIHAVTRYPDQTLIRMPGPNGRLYTSNHKKVDVTTWPYYTMPDARDYRWRNGLALLSFDWERRDPLGECDQFHRIKFVAWARQLSRLKIHHWKSRAAATSVSCMRQKRQTMIIRSIYDIIDVTASHCAWNDSVEKRVRDEISC